MGASQNQPFQLSFNRFLRIDFQGPQMTSNHGLLLVRELDERLDLTGLTDATRLARDPTFRLMGSEKVRERDVALTSTSHWFERDLLPREENLTGLARLNRELLARAEGVQGQGELSLTREGGRRSFLRKDGVEIGNSSCIYTVARLPLRRGSSFCSTRLPRVEPKRFASRLSTKFLWTKADLTREGRDHPDRWKAGDFPMDVSLQAKLRRDTQLILGDVAATVPEFVKRQSAPVGFVAFDLDLYSSTRAAMQLFTLPGHKILPHTPVYFDDISQAFNHSFAGELLAIDEFNRESECVKFDRWRGVKWLTSFPESPWLDAMYMAHDLTAAPTMRTEVLLL